MRDLTGQRFGRLIARQPTTKRSGTSIVWECTCDCGATAFVKSAHLCTGQIRSCGCLKKEYFERNSMRAAEEMVGQRFGRLTVVAMSAERNHGRILWECRCDCGNTVVAEKYCLENGTKKSCGCLLKDHMKVQGRKSALDLTGQRFGRLTVMQPTEERKRQSVVWECKCDCGATAFVSCHNLKYGKTRSCGCLRKKITKQEQAEELETV